MMQMENFTDKIVKLEEETTYSFVPSYPNELNLTQIAGYNHKYITYLTLQRTSPYTRSITNTPNVETQRKSIFFTIGTFKILSSECESEISEVL